MKIKDLPRFRIEIGNTCDEDGEYLDDVFATNDGIVINGIVVSTYEDYDIFECDDLIDTVNDAIYSCESMDDENKDGLTDVLYSTASMDFEYWWKENNL